MADRSVDPDRHVDPYVLEALNRSGLPTNGRIMLFHATSVRAAADIFRTGKLQGDESGLVELGSSDEIAVLRDQPRATATAALPHKVTAIVELEVDVAQLHDAHRRGEIEIFYMLAGPVDIRCVRRWP